MYRNPEILVAPASELRRGIELYPVTSHLLRGARSDLSHYRLDAALGVTTDLDKEGLEYFVARRSVNNDGPMHPSVSERVYQDLDALIAAYRQECPEGSKRPYHIQSGIRTIFEGLETHPIRGLRHRTARARLAAHEYATPWRELIQAESHR